MKLFLDTAIVSDIEDRVSTGLIHGITTNPTLIKKSGRDPWKVYSDIVELGIEDLSQDTIDKANTIFDLTAMINENKNNGKSTEVLEKERQEFLEDYIGEIQRKAVGGVDMATVQAQIFASRMAVVYGMIDDNPSLTKDTQLSDIAITRLPDEVQTAIEGMSIEDINRNETVLGDSKQLFRNLQQQTYVTQQYNIAIAFTDDIDYENSDPLGLLK